MDCQSVIKQGETDYDLMVSVFFSKVSSISVKPVSYQTAVCCKIVWVLFLVVFFFYWLWSGFTAWNKNERSGLIMNFSPLLLIQMENGSSPETTKLRWQSSFCEGCTVSFLTKYCTGLIWLSGISVAKSFCGIKKLYFEWFSCSFFA